MMNGTIEKYLPKDKRVRMVILMFMDVTTMFLSSFLGLFIRFDMNVAKIPPEYIQAVSNYIIIYIAVTLIIFFLFHMYSTMWSVAGIREVTHIIAACGLASLIQLAGMTLLENKVPRSYYIICFATLCTLEVVIRLSYRIGKTMFSASNFEKSGKIIIA